MSNGHFIKYHDFGDGKYKPRCKCGWPSHTETMSLQEAQDAAREHHRNIEVIKAYLGKRNPSLEDQADYFRARSLEDPVKKNRDVWAQMADELDTRLGRNAPPSVQEEIPF